ncbi:MAG: 50S ribosomal protein L24 [Candidatus Blackburnbacteria bacterium]|nr:50S ribosomal protein L24 [Candidatus Blackburnbacteria bacterium]
MKLHIGDEVLVTAGKDKGRRGKIEHVFPKKDRVVVPGVNVYKRHRKGMGGEKGGVSEFSRPLFVASVAFFCTSCNKPTRIVYEVAKTGEKTRVCAKCRREI